MEFKVGDRVGVKSEYGRIGHEDRWADGLFGTVCVTYNYDVGIDFDEHIHGHDCGGAAKAGHGWFVRRNYLFHVDESDLASIQEDKLMEVLLDG